MYVRSFDTTNIRGLGSKYWNYYWSYNFFILRRNLDVRSGEKTNNDIRSVNVHTEKNVRRWGS